MSDDNRIRTGLWKSDKGGYSGKVQITEPGEYWVNLYKNDRKTADTHPDLNLVLKPKDGARASAPRQASAEPEDDLPF